MTMLRTDRKPAAAADDRAARRARRRFVRRQWARRWLAWRTLVVAVLVTGLVAGGGWLVFFSPVLAVQGVAVRGTDLLAVAAVRRAAAVPTGHPLATVNLAAVRARVENLAPVLFADVSRDWPDKILVVVTERTPVAVVDRGGRLRGVDAHGVLFRGYRNRPAGLPLLRAGAKADTEAVAEAARVVGSLPAALAAKVAHVRVRTVDTITLVLHNGDTVLWGSAAGSTEKARVLAVLLQHRARFYDVSVPDQPVIRR